MPRYKQKKCSPHYQRRDTMFENVDHSMDKTTNGTESFGCEISSQKQHQMQHDFEKVQSVLKNLVRDWNDLGAAERKQCYSPILDELDELFPLDEYSDLQSMQVLVPGSELGWLEWEVSSAPVAALERCEQCEQCEQGDCTGRRPLQEAAQKSTETRPPGTGRRLHTVHPWVHQYVNNTTCEHQLLGDSFPDVPVCARHDTNFSITAGDFLRVYTESDEWHCVATCFFIDCAQNVIEFVERIYAILRPGGFWINLGPLLYHYSNMPTKNRSVPSHGMLLEILREVGFDILKDKTGLKTKYAQNPNSMMQHEYDSIFFVCRKPYRM